MNRELLLGCGHRRDKLLSSDGCNTFGEDLVTLDHNVGCKPDVLHDLNRHPLPFADSSFEEIHAYEVLEHLGQQGDYAFFFREFSEYWRILVPGGLFFATVPSIRSPWVWGDPSHRRVVSLETLTFLSQDAYGKQAGRTPMTDFRPIYHADFELRFSDDDGDHLAFALEAIKEPV